MTVSPNARRLRFTDLPQAQAVMRRRGLRLSTARRLILEAMFAAAGPVSAEHLAAALDLDAASVYRNLETLEQHGLTQHVHLGHGPGLYVLVGRGEQEFLCCDRCNAVRTLTPDQLDPVREEIRKLFGYQARFTHFPIVGLCPVCVGKAGADESHRQRGGDMSDEPHDHEHEHPHSHEHTHEGTGEHNGVVHAHPHTDHEHEHVEHEHEHSHGDRVHSHPHPHEEGLEDQHEHGH